MGSAVVGIVGTLPGVVIGGALQRVQAVRNRKWQKEDALSDTKRGVYAEYVRAISASYGKAITGQWSPSEEANLYAAVAEIEILSSEEVARPARDLVETVIRVHSKISSTGTDEAKALVADVDLHRHEVIDLFRADLRLKVHR